MPSTRVNFNEIDGCMPDRKTSCRFAYYGHFIEVELYSVWFLVTGFFHLTMFLRSIRAITFIRT